MKKKNFYRNEAKVYFKRWTNKPFAIFNSIKKIIIILTLPTVYLNSMAQDTIMLENCTINGIMPVKYYQNNFKLIKFITAEEIDDAGVNGLPDLLKFFTSIDIRQRGMDDVQADVSLRGGNFDQVLVLLNGIPISDHQTGHHSLNLPVSKDQIERIEILRGPGQSQAGFNSYSGAINIITKSTQKSNLFFSSSYGQFGYRNSNLNLNFNTNKIRNFISLGQSSSNGYTENTDFFIHRLFLNSTYINNNFIINFQTGIMNKGFGAFNFYTPAFPYQYEAINNQIASVKIIYRKPDFISTLKIYGRRNQDKFELFREDPNWYQHIGNYWIKDNTDTAKYIQSLYIPSIYYQGHNYHQTYTAGANLSTDIKTFIFTFNYNYFVINSNVLGDKTISLSVPFEKNALFTKMGEMQNFSFSVAKNITIAKIYNIKTAASLNYNSKFNFFYTFSFENALKLNNSRIYLSVNQGMRLPTFTDLYYQGPSNYGNKDLKPEKNTNFETGINFSNSIFNFDADAFYRIGKNTIDWVKEIETDKWTPMNYTELNTFGVEFSSKVRLNTILKQLKYFALNYTFLHQTKNTGTYISKYVLDYPIHSLSIALVAVPTKNLTLSTSFLYKKRNGSLFLPNDFGVIEEIFFPTNILLNSKLEYKYKTAKFFVSADNILNNQIYDLSYIKLPGRWIKWGISITL